MIKGNDPMVFVNMLRKIDLLYNMFRVLCIKGGQNS